jgi:prepilin-type N-terminal cleavage/methylation domain-containing protein
MTTHNPRRARGFTLVEMLVVMAIIAILAGILLPAIGAAIRAAKNSKIAQELSQLHNAIESYKQKLGDYPPDFSSVTKLADLSDSTNVVARHLRKAFPRHAENNTTFSTFFADKGGTFHVPDPSEALVFWLAGLKNDPRLPLSGSGENLKFMDFKADQLQDPDNNGWFSYVPKDGKGTPYVYFDSRTYKFTYGTTVRYAFYQVAGATVCPYLSSVMNDYANPTTFQIISAGLDGDYGTTTLTPNPSTPPWSTTSVPTCKIFPTGMNYVIGDYDNLTNFSEGRILEDHMP